MTMLNENSRTYISREIEEFDSYESLVLLEQHAEKQGKSFLEGKVLCTATGSNNLFWILEASAFKGTKIAYNVNSDFAFKHLEEDLFSKVAVENLASISKDYRGEVSLIMAEYESSFSWFNAVEEISTAVVNCLKDQGCVSIWAGINEELESSVELQSRYERIYYRVSKAVDFALKDDIKNVTIEFMLALTNIKAPYTNREKMEYVIRNMAKEGMHIPDELHKIITKLSSANVATLSKSYAMTEILQERLFKRNKGFRLLGTSSVTNEGVRIYGSVHRLKNLGYKSIEHACSGEPIFPNFSFHEKYNVTEKIKELSGVYENTWKSVTSSTYQLIKERIV